MITLCGILFLGLYLFLTRKSARLNGISHYYDYDYQETLTQKEKYENNIINYYPANDKEE